MKVNLQITDLDQSKTSKYERTEVLEMTLDVTSEMIPAVVQMIGASITAHLTTRLHAISLGVEPAIPEPE